MHTLDDIAMMVGVLVWGYLAYMAYRDRSWLWFFPSLAIMLWGVYDSIKIILRLL